MEKERNRNLMLYEFKNVDIQWQQPQEINICRDCKRAYLSEMVCEISERGRRS
jgi:hypothetical protein